MKLKPYGNLLLVKILPDQEVKTKSGLVMPDTVALPAPLVCEIISTGEQTPKDLQRGDKILVPRDAAALPLEDFLSPAEDGGTYKLVFPNTVIAMLVD